MVRTSNSQRARPRAALSAQPSTPSSATLSPKTSSSRTLSDHASQHQESHYTVSWLDSNATDDSNFIENSPRGAHQTAYLTPSHSSDPRALNTASQVAEAISPYESALWAKPLRMQMKWITRQHVVLSVRYAALSEDSPYISLKCSHFEPEDSDIVHRKWGNQPQQIREIPSYCAVDVTEIFSQLEELIQGYTQYYYRQMNINPWKVPGIEPSTIPNIVTSTFKIALKYQERSRIVRDAVRIWIGSRLCAAKRTLLSEESLGMSVINVEDAPDFGHIPIPPMLDYQLDTIMIQWMESGMKQMLKQLWSILLKRHKKDWFEVYLSIFILIHNLEVVFECQKVYIQLHQDAPYGRKIAAFSEPMLEQWQWTAKHLLFVYHYHMRRAAFGDAPMFQESFLDDAIAFADLDDEDQDYLRIANHWITEQVPECGMSAYADVHQMTWCRNLMQNPKSA
ncbi:hypothetical protein DM02DRAFT_656926 [Periconia macrospinosa]|uniref:Uncharacterized protein n=1 Tax=Periconia macrospinosa TaxID=97972 RepID=A0A2V1DL12_9PLEO|nr:hypothetical protein DM02DRAFT_656926 [Periconia macrospinosa]